MIHQPTPPSPSASSLRPLGSPSSPPTASLTSLRELDRQQAVEQERERFNTPLPRRRRPGIVRELSDPGSTSSVGDSMFGGQGNGAAGHGQQSYASMVSAGLERPQLGNGAGGGAGAGPAGGGPGGVGESLAPSGWLACCSWLTSLTWYSLANVATTPETARLHFPLSTARHRRPPQRARRVLQLRRDPAGAGAHGELEDERRRVEGRAG